MIYPGSRPQIHALLLRPFSNCRRAQVCVHGIVVVIAPLSLSPKKVVALNSSAISALPHSLHSYNFFQLFFLFSSFLFISSSLSRSRSPLTSLPIVFCAV